MEVLEKFLNFNCHDVNFLIPSNDKDKAIDKGMFFIVENTFPSNQALDYLDISDNLSTEVPKNLPTSILQLYFTNNSISRINYIGSFPQMIFVLQCTTHRSSINIPS